MSHINYFDMIRSRRIESSSLFCSVHPVVFPLFLFLNSSNSSSSCSTFLLQSYCKGEVASQKFTTLDILKSFISDFIFAIDSHMTA